MKIWGSDGELFVPVPAGENDFFFGYILVKCLPGYFSGAGKDFSKPASIRI
jgi:hypothetical protein